MKILVTGCAGFIGSHLTEKLIKSGGEIVGVDNFNSFYNPRFKEENIKPLLKKKNFRLYRTDIRDKKEIGQIFKREKPERVIHLAARAGVRPSLEKPLLYQQVNIGGTLNILEGCRKHQAKQLIFASSSSVYGGQTKVPFSENDPADRPISPYAATKRAGELLCHTYHHLYDLPITCLRFFTVYGPKGRPDMAPYLFTQSISREKEIKMFGDGTSQRDYTYIDDIVAGILGAVDKKLDFEIINLGNSKTIRLKYFIGLIGRLLNKKPRIKQVPEQPGDVPLTYADISKAKKLLGYNPETSIEKGMEKFISWYQKERA